MLAQAIGALVFSQAQCCIIGTGDLWPFLVIPQGIYPYFVFRGSWMDIEEEIEKWWIFFSKLLFYKIRAKYALKVTQIQSLWVSVGMCSHCSLLRISPAVSPMPAGSVVSSAELRLLSLTPPDLYSFSPGLLEEGNKNKQAFWRPCLFKSTLFEITTFICFYALEGVSEDTASSFRCLFWGIFEWFQFWWVLN